MSNGDISNVTHSDGHTLVRADHNVSDVIGIAHQTDAANVIKLSTLRVEAAAGIGIVGGKAAVTCGMVR